ncbi:diiron oxygenase [Nocardia altamirensis]|uniref:diiron oxygenase n=1 Tax=Nocardia altamirensis TaxID=472158 RepID=UPI000A066E15|nr:diiron oxygenase [Nocardia altamirensis]
MRDPEESPITMGTPSPDPIEFHSPTTTSGTPVRRRRTVADRALSARRLLLDAAAETYDGDLDIDWSAPIDPEKHWLPDQLSTIHGTWLWHRMGTEQRATLAKHELANLLTLAIYADAARSMLLFRDIIEASGPADDETRAALAAIHADSRTMAMFGRMVHKSGLAPYRRPLLAQAVSRLVLLTPRNTATSAVTLLIQQAIHDIAAVIADDPQVQPHLRQLMKIHCVGARRNLAYAHDQLLAEIDEHGTISNRLAALWAALATVALYPAIIAARPYRAAGVSPKHALPTAYASGHYTEAAGAITESFVRQGIAAGLFDGPLTTTILRLGRVWPGSIPRRHR